jgi:hypothetical protein
MASSGVVATTRHNRKGELQESSAVTAALEVALKHASLPRIPVHDLRNTSASVLPEAGAPKLVEDLLITAQWRSLPILTATSQRD